MNETADATRRGITLSAEETDRLYRISARVNAGVSVEQILDAVFEEFRPILPYDRMEYAHVGKGGTRLTTAWVRTTYEPVVLGLATLSNMNLRSGKSPIRWLLRISRMTSLDMRSAREPITRLTISRLRGSGPY